MKLDGVTNRERVGVEEEGGERGEDSARKSLGEASGRKEKRRKGSTRRMDGTGALDKRTDKHHDRKIKKRQAVRKREAYV